MRTLPFLLVLAAAPAFGQAYYVNRTPLDHPEGQIVNLRPWLGSEPAQDTFVADSFVADREFQFREIRLFRPQIPGFTIIGYDLFAGETWDSRTLLAQGGGSLFDRGPVPGSPNLLREYEASDAGFKGLFPAGKYWLRMSNFSQNSQYALVLDADDNMSIVGNRETGTYRTVTGDLGFRVGLIPEPASLSVLALGFGLYRRKIVRR